MTALHAVLPGETISSVAELYEIPEERLINDNELQPNMPLDIGQVLMIAYPEETYRIAEGDTLAGIAEAKGVTVMELLRNNPNLSDREALIVGEELIIRYDNKGKKLQINGFTFTYITESVLRKTLPFLTYITIVGYQVKADGSLTDIDDSMIIETARAYSVLPIMFISTMDNLGQGSYEVTHELFNNPELQGILMTNILATLKAKNYYGISLGFQFIMAEDLSNYVDFIKKTAEILNNENFGVDVVLTPNIFGYREGTMINPSLLEETGQAANSVNLLDYQWAINYIPEAYEATYTYLRGYLDYVVTLIPPEKIFIGLTRIAYDWELPYIENQSYGISLTTKRALEFANQLGATILYEPNLQQPYFYYNEKGVEHIVWFKDARTASSIINLVYEYGLKGLSVWSIMNYYAQTWILLNSQYDIEKLLPVS